MSEWKCRECGSTLEIVTEDYGDYAGPNYPCCVVMVKKTRLKHPWNSCQFQHFEAELEV
jgi:hypothetical protein